MVCTHTHTYTEGYCEFSWDENSINSFLPLKKGKVGTVVVTIATKVPSWYHIIKDTVGISVLSHKDGGLVTLSGQGSPSPDVLQSSSSSASNTPNSSPIMKRPRGARGWPAKRKSSEDSSYSGSSLMESLNLDHPSFSLKGTKTLPSIPRRLAYPQSKAQSLGRHQKPPGRDDGLMDVEAALDLDSMSNKRASVRSDPGDRDNRPARNRPKPDSKPIPIPKTDSITAASRIPEIGSVIESSPIPEPRLGHTPTHQRMSSHPKFTSGIRVGSLKIGPGHRRQVAPLHKGVISEPLGPVFKELPRLPNNEMVTGEFKVEFTGGQGAEEGFYREVVSKVPVTVRPCVMFEQFDIAMVTRYGQGGHSVCALSCDVPSLKVSETV